MLLDHGRTMIAETPALDCTTRAMPLMRARMQAARRGQLQLLARRSRAHARTRTRGRLALLDFVSKNSSVSEHLRCAALLHGGKQCRSVALAGMEFCPHHTRLVEQHGAEALKRGEHLPVPRNRVVQAPVIAEVIEVMTGNGTATVDPASVRPRLAEAAAASVDEIRRVLLETATGANRNLWATINCKHCGRAGRYEITVPDNKVRRTRSRRSCTSRSFDLVRLRRSLLRRFRPRSSRCASCPGIR